MDLNKYFTDNYKLLAGSSSFVKNRYRIKCVDGFSLSVQASRTHYCRPREDEGPYSAVEVGYTSERVESFIPFAEDADNPLDTIYGWVPIELVEEAIESHGGMKEE